MNKDAALFQALGDPTRLRILALLRRMELAVGELAQILGQSQPRVSKHLKTLLDCGLVARRREGNWIFFSRGEAALMEPIFVFLDRLVEYHGESAWIAADAARLVAINAERSDEAARYFAAHAGEWDALRSLHVPTDQVGDAILAAIGDRRPGRVVDLGTGTGTIVQLLGPKADHIIGIDRSPEMLRYGRARLAELAITNAELRQGDMYRLDMPSGSADTVILHQVLHYAQHPATAIAEAARLLDRDGRLLVIDVARHDREDLRRNHAHVRLGFSDEEMLGYFKAAGLKGDAVAHLAGGELTVTIWSGQRNRARLKIVS